MSSFSSSSTKKEVVRRLLRLLLSFFSLSSISGNSLFANFVGKHSWIWVNASVALLKLLVYFCHCSLGSQERGRHWIPRPREREQSEAGLIRYYRRSLNIMQSLHYRSFVTTRGLLSITMISWGFSSALICSWRVALKSEDNAVLGRERISWLEHFHYFWSRPDGYITKVHREKCAKVPDDGDY